MPPVDDNSTEAAQFDRMFAIVVIPAALFLLACVYVRVTSDTDPLWSEFGTPLFLALIGVRAVLRPVPSDKRKTARAVGFLLIGLSAVIVVLAIVNARTGS